MPLLPVVVPDIPESRSEVVAARLARKVAPLFGVPWAGAPFGLTWVCDYSTLTLSEIARGAPLPPRGDGPPRGLETDWALAGRAVVTTPGERLANELAHATLNRYGPDTKAAVVLTAANLLFLPITTAIGVAQRFLDIHEPGLTARQRLAGWAGMVLEAFRSQPALFVAGVQARAVQRALLTRWELPLPRHLDDERLARCEIGARTSTGVGGGPQSPSTFEVADLTATGLNLTAHHDLAERWLLRLAALGTEGGDGYLWLGERSAGHRVVECYLPHTPTIGAYLTETAPLIGPDTDPPHLPTIPEPATLAELTPLARRAVLLALTTVIRQVRFDPEQREGTRATMASTLDRLIALADAALPEHDPVTVITRCRAADIRVHTLRHDLTNPVAGPLRALLQAMDTARELYRAGDLDRGDLAELLYSGNVEINVVARHNLSDNTLATRLGESWDAFLDALDLDLGQLSEEDTVVRDQAGFHLSAYSSYLAGQSDTVDLHRAVHLFRTVVVPARERRYQLTARFQPLRQSLQTASRATTELARRALADSDRDCAREWAELGRNWINQALADEHTQRLLDHDTEAACHFALLAAPALLIAHRSGVRDCDTTDLDQAERLLGVARRFATKVTDGGGRYARESDIETTSRLLDECRRLSVIPEHE